MSDGILRLAITDSINTFAKRQDIDLLSSTKVFFSRRINIQSDPRIFDYHPDYICEVIAEMLGLVQTNKPSLFAYNALEDITDKLAMLNITDVRKYNARYLNRVEILIETILRSEFEDKYKLFMRIENFLNTEFTKGRLEEFTSALAMQVKLSSLDIKDAVYGSMVTVRPGTHSLRMTQFNTQNEFKSALAKDVISAQIVKHIEKRLCTLDDTVKDGVIDAVITWLQSVKNARTSREEDMKKKL